MIELEQNVSCTSLTTISLHQGLEVGDEILNFGSLNFDNFQEMQNLATVVQHSKDVSFTE